jgi:hypothetical protein
LHQYLVTSWQSCRFVPREAHRGYIGPLQDAAQKCCWQIFKWRSRIFSFHRTACLFYIQDHGGSRMLRTDPCRRPPCRQTARLSAPTAGAKHLVSSQHKICQAHPAGLVLLPAWHTRPCISTLMTTLQCIVSTRVSYSHAADNRRRAITERQAAKSAWLKCENQRRSSAQRCGALEQTAHQLNVCDLGIQIVLQSQRQCTSLSIDP